MRTRSLVAVLGVALFALAAPSQASQRGHPGSLLVFPEFDNSPGATMLATVTNTNRDPVNGSVETVWTYVGEGCIDFQRTEVLTAGDTITVLTSFHNPTTTRGYLFVVARSPITGKASPFDWLIGTSTSLDGLASGGYTVDPLSFRGLGGDLDGDGIYRLDGDEYEAAPAQCLLPRFFGQESPGGQGFLESDLVLVDLTGGRHYTATARLFVYNDNEEQFSVLHTFPCWTKEPLLAISPVFDNDFLKSTNHDPSEIVGQANLEAGWMIVDGETTVLDDGPPILDPVILAVLVDRRPNDNTVQPFFRGQQSNGSLLPTPIVGNP